MSNERESSKETAPEEPSHATQVKVPNRRVVSTTISAAHMEILATHQTNKKYAKLNKAVEDAADALQNITKGPEALRNQFKERFGLRKMIYPANGQDYSDLMEKAEELTLVFNDMRHWLDNHRHRNVLRERLVQNRYTRIYLLHPNSKLIDFIAQISGKLHDVVRGKNRQERDVERAVRQLCSKNRGYFNNRKDGDEEQFHIIGHRYFNTYTMVMTESECRIVWYPIARRGNPGTIFIFDRANTSEDYYRELKEDIKELDRVARDNYQDSDLIKLFSPPSRKARQKTSTGRKRKKKS